MADKVKFSELLGLYRTRCGWSQGELGTKIGVHRNTIASWESGDRHPQSRGEILRLADELQLSKEERNGFLKATGLSEERWPADYWNVPYPRNPYFVGRETVLQSLRQTLVPGAKTTALTQIISGLGGIGKTQVAIEYAHRYGEHYEAVLWIQADSLEIATAACLQLATQVLGLPEQQEADQQIAEIKRWLQKRHGWLLILDNVEDPQEILSTFVPSKHKGSVLITTRRRDVGALSHSEILPLLPEDDATLFLLRRARRIAKNASVTETTSDDFFLARDLCQLLDRLPLALDQAGAYIAENGCSLRHYIDLYHQFRPILLDRRNADGQRSGSHYSDHPDSVLMTFWLSWDQIQQRNILAGKVLQFCSFLAPNQIPESLVQAGVLLSENEGAVDDLEMDEAVGLLHRYSLIERAEQTLSLHRLVQEVMQEVLSKTERQQWMERALLVVNAAFPSGKHETWSQCEFLLPHALACIEWINTLRMKKREARRLLSATGLYLYERAQYREAEPLLEQAMRISEEQFGASHPHTATSLSNLAALYQAQGRYRETEPLLKQALSIREELLGASHPHTAPSLNNLAALYYAQGRYSEAEPLLKQALSIQEELLGASHPDTASGLNNLAALYQAQGRYRKAEPLLKRAILISEELLGASHPDTTPSLSNLAALYQAQGRYNEAESLYRRALLISEEQLGTSHPHTAANQSYLAALYQAQGRYSEAVPLLKQALSIQEEQLGASHPDTASGLNNLAEFYQAQGRYGEAESLYRRALLISEEQLGVSHPHIATRLNNLAALYQAQGRYSEAEPLLKQAVLISEEQLGTSHPDTAPSLNNLAALYQAQGRYREAESLLKRTILISEEQLGASHPHTATGLNNLAELYRTQGRYGEAEPLYQQALSIREKQLGASHPHTAISLNNLAELYRTQERFEEAEPLYQRALLIFEEQLGASHPTTATGLNNLALLYESQERYKKAEPLYRRALLISEEQLGASHPDTVASLNNLAGFYQAQGRYDEAEPLYQRAVKVSMSSLGMNHPQTQQILMSHLTLLSHIYTNGDMDELIRLLASLEE
jgi:tetratricopeptide (TPR) repeat protein/transcriptional regulator with XRE-family HTH domain